MLDFVTKKSRISWIRSDYDPMLQKITSNENAKSLESL